MPKKHNIAYVKPDEPSFLRKLKQQIGYKEGPTVNTKREDLERAGDEDFLDGEEEQPQVVVLRPGDLSAQEAAQEKLRLEKEEEEKPADLDAPIVFKKPVKKTTSDSSGTSSDTQKDKEETKTSKRSLDSTDKDKKSKKKLKNNKSLLSFDEEEEEED
ncbi:unnamed protein product [Ceutorhynchus assimilis]|uniref:DUF4604 domain-containing protein n=1 Tax=Ceutorhynchus assimilis TaxID=467358 RepID=A0A9N9MEQ6_9CUCU|nr:unnamed protein product [Ceutorhynchus assimilis]